jgi:hypothetical protein
MSALLATIAGLMRLRAGPQDLPYSPPLLAALLVAQVGLDGLAAHHFGAGDGLLLRAVVAVLVGLGVPYLVLSVARRTARFVQTATAIVATGLAFALLVLPVVALVGRLPDDPAELTAGQVLFGWLSLALLAWKLVVQGSIFRHALEVPLRQGVLLAVALLLVELAAGLLIVASRAAAA